MQKFGLHCFMFLLSTSVSAFAGSIPTYQELASAMRAGDHFVILVDVQECTGRSGMPTGYFIPSKMMLVPASNSNSERIVTSDLHFTDYTGGASYEYTKYTFNSDDSVVIHTVIYDPVTFKQTGTAHVINCSLGKGVSIQSSGLTPVVSGCLSE